MSKETLTIDQVEEIYQLIKYAFIYQMLVITFFDEEGNDVVNSFQYDEKVLQENLKHHYSTKIYANTIIQKNIQGFLKHLLNK